MRSVLVLLAAAAALVVPASAASVDPRLLVLHQVDVPARYFFDEENSMLLPRALVAQPGKGARILKQSGFQTGYFARYLNSGPPRWRYVTSLAYVFRQPKGARIFMSWVTDTGFAHAGGRVTPVDLGDKAWMHTLALE